MAKEVKIPGLAVAEHLTGLNDKVKHFENTVLSRQYRSVKR